jgi:Holliday junction resolvasome RuvABC endonuclease subunit
MTVLALDLGTNLGWAVSYGPNDILHGTIEFRTGRYEGGGMRWLRFRTWLRGMHDEHGPIDAIYFEEVRAHKGVDAAHIYGGFLAQLTAWCEQNEVPYQGISVGAIKKHATGKGNANKLAMMLAMREKGFTPRDDNDADALALLLLVLDENRADA